MTQPFGDQPVLPLDQEAQITIRHLRVIAALLDTGDRAALYDLADALERSLNHSGVVQQ